MRLPSLCTPVLCALFSIGSGCTIDYAVHDATGLSEAPAAPASSDDPGPDEVDPDDAEPLEDATSGVCGEALDTCLGGADGAGGQGDAPCFEEYDLCLGRDPLPYCDHLVSRCVSEGGEAAQCEDAYAGCSDGQAGEPDPVDACWTDLDGCLNGSDGAGGTGDADCFVEYDVCLGQPPQPYCMHLLDYCLVTGGIESECYEDHDLCAAQ